MIKNILLVAAGGAAGSVARYLLAKALHGTVFGAFPVGTMAANILGCLAIGLISGLAAGEGAPVGQDLKLLLTVGFCGGFTTFSTFMNESLTLCKTGDAMLAAVYVGASVALGFAAVAAGLFISKQYHL